MSAFELVLTGAAHGGTGYIFGSAVDAFFPPLADDDGTVTKSSVRVAGEALLQFTLGFWAMGEVMRMLLPRSDYVSPIGDGTSSFFFFYAQSRLLQKLDYLRSQVHMGEMDPLKSAKRPLPSSGARAHGSGSV
jgi:hypothetical protein